MTQPPGPPPPPPPPGFQPAIYPPPPPGIQQAAYAAPPGYVPPAAYGLGGQPGHGRVSPTRLILVFVIVLVVALAVGGAIVFALQPAAKAPLCPDPTQQCGQPPIAPTLPPNRNATPSPAGTPAPTIVRPSGPVQSVLPSASAPPTIGPTAAPSALGSAQPSPGDSARPTASITPGPTVVGLTLPQPRPPSNAGPLRLGETWSSSAIGFQLEYDANLWTIADEAENGVLFSAGDGAVRLVVEGFPAADMSPKQAIQQMIDNLGNEVLGLTEEDDPERQLPGRPAIGHIQGDGVLLNGTLNSPQGPTAAADVVIIAASDNQVTLRVTLITEDDLREPAFHIVDSVLDAIEWPGSAQ